MRLFTALDLPPGMLLRFEQLLSDLRPLAPIQWSPLDNLHITTRFIGEWPEDQLPSLDNVLATLRSRHPIDITLHQFGWFLKAGAPRVLWAGVDGGAALVQLAQQTSDALVSLGIALDPHPFTPHLTLARIKLAQTQSNVPLAFLHAKVEELQSAVIGLFQAGGFHLYSSSPGSDSSIYRKIRSYPFETNP